VDALVCERGSNTVSHFSELLTSGAGGAGNGVQGNLRAETAALFRFAGR
jgi:hypothetical protein